MLCLLPGVVWGCLLFRKNRFFGLFFVLLFFPGSFFGDSGTFVYKRFYFHFEGVDRRELDELSAAVSRAEAFFVLRFDFQSFGSLDIVIAPSVNGMCSSLNIPSWIGGYYKPGRVFIQPLPVLKKKGVFEKVLFTEIAHDIIDGYTGGKCPAWFNEAASYYYYLIYSGALTGPVVKEPYFKSYISLTDLETILKDKNAARAFYAESLAFILFLNSRSETFCEKLFLALHKGSSFDDAVLVLTGSSPEELFALFSGVKSD